MNASNVLVVDDSAVIRGMLTRILEEDGDIKVVATASNGEIALKTYDQYKPDVVVLDIEMPVMDGITTLKHLIKKDPHARVLMCSTLTLENAQISLEAMSIGAVDYIPKPTSTAEISGNDHFKETLRDLVRAISRPRTGGAPAPAPQSGGLPAGFAAIPPKGIVPSNKPQRAPIPPAPTLVAGTPSAPAPAAASAPVSTPSIPQIPAPTLSSESRSGKAFPQPIVMAPGEKLVQTRTGETITISEKFSLRPEPTAGWRPKILAVGSSTGGPQALFGFFKALKAKSPLANTPIVITQHMPATFTALLAQHITQQTGIPCDEASEGAVIKPGRALLAKGGLHMLAKRDGTDIKVTLDDGPQENFCKPAVDPMLRSLIPIYGRDILVVILTGMGQDGALGAKAVSQGGGYAAAQDQKSSVVWGMPGATACSGVCSFVGNLDELGAWAARYIS